TWMLIASLPSLQGRRKLSTSPGLPPGLVDPPDGCLFHPRCPHAGQVCSRQVPQLRSVNVKRARRPLPFVRRDHCTVTPLLEIRDVTKRFGGGLFDKRQLTALAHFSLTVPSDRAARDRDRRRERQRQDDVGTADPGDSVAVRGADPLQGPRSGTTERRQAA